MSTHALAFVLAGGKGERLEPLTDERAKPAVRFGAQYRLIDFALSNVVNSGIPTVAVLAQYLPRSIYSHVNPGFSPYFRAARGEYIDVLEAHHADPESDAYAGTADAIWHHIDRVNGQPQVNVLSADHAYYLDLRPSNAKHMDRRADITIFGLTVPVNEAAGRFGVLGVDERGQVRGFEEKPQRPVEIPGRPGYCLASMGIYTFSPQALRRSHARDIKKQRVAHKTDIVDPEKQTTHDFGYDVIPQAIRDGMHVYVDLFSENAVPGMEAREKGYWVDVGTLDSFYGAHRDLTAYLPQMNLYNDQWPLLTHAPARAPAKQVGRQETDSIIIGPGSIVTQSDVVNSVVSADSRVDHSTITDSVLLGNNRVRGARLRRTIVDENVVLPDGIVIGEDRTEDERRGYRMSPGGVVVVSKRNFPD